MTETIHNILKELTSHITLGILFVLKSPLEFPHHFSSVQKIILNVKVVRAHIEHRKKSKNNHLQSQRPEKHGLA